LPHRHIHFNGAILNLSFWKAPPLSARLHRLKSSPLFGTLTPLELKTVDAVIHERSYLDSEIIFDQGEEGHALYLLLSGRVAINRMHGNDIEPVTELGPGAFFGDLALLDNSPRLAQARAKGGCMLAVFFRADFTGIMDTDPVLGYKVSLALARHLGQSIRGILDGATRYEIL
jgi:CRP/FNR family cyclic AMP-dependent transcriptional regulator